jgi:hypothetical protein
MERSKETVARRLAEAHYSIEPGIVRIVRLLASPQEEQNAHEPVKLLEVNENTTADGIRPIYFASRPRSGIHYACIIVEVAPEEFELIRANPSMLPNRWQLGEEYPRTPAAIVGS